MKHSFLRLLLALALCFLAAIATAEEMLPETVDAGALCAQIPGITPEDCYPLSAQEDILLFAYELDGESGCAWYSIPEQRLVYRKEPCSNGSGFCNGFAAAFDDAGSVVFDTAGQEVRRFEGAILEDAGFTCELPFVFSSEAEGFFLYDPASDVLTRPAQPFDEIQAFSGGFAMVAHEGLYGFIDRSGETVIPMIYPSAQQFSEGRAPVYDGKRWHILTADGHLLTDEGFLEVYGYSEALCGCVNEAGLLGFIDLQGNWQIEPQFESFMTTWFLDGEAVICTGDNFITIDRAGRVTAVSEDE